MGPGIENSAQQGHSEGAQGHNTLDDAARELAHDLDANDARAVQRLRADAAVMDKQKFDEFLKLVNKYEQNGKGVDVVVGSDGEQFLTFANPYLGEVARGRFFNRERIPAQEAERKQAYAKEAQVDGPVKRADRPERDQ